MLRVDGDTYRVIGMITYRNRSDSACWSEYRMISDSGGREKWLSIDDIYREYSICEVTKKACPPGYHLVDSGTEEVVSAWGDVDVDIGETASFEEFEDSTEEKIFSLERWEDGIEASSGYYLDYDEIEYLGSVGGGDNYNSNFRSNHSGGKGTKNKNILAWVIVALFFLPYILIDAGNLINTVPKISKYLKKSTLYSYVTSVTGRENQKADVYKSVYDIDGTVKDIIDAIEGNTEEVHQNTEDGDQSVGILTKKEYCLVYVSEEGDVLVQVSSRKYAYYNDTSPYRSTAYTHRYYRRFYLSTGYYGDSSDYKGGTSPYSSYDDTTISTGGDAYDSYSGSVRQSSTSSRTSSGGGTSSGK